VDMHPPAARSHNMRAIKSRNTQPELAVRRLVFGLGLRFRIHRRDLPGSPDLVLPRHKCVIFVHGCFWHRHLCKAGQACPATNRVFWDRKFDQNKLRDRKVKSALSAAGWRVLTVWECQTRKPEELRQRIQSFIDGNPAGSGRSRAASSTRRRRST
jgi:DNA mismatch endonuclease, patch repair protein